MAAVALNSGVDLVYFVEVPLLTASRGSIAVSSESLLSLAVFDLMKKKKRQITLEVQPQRLGSAQQRLRLCSTIAAGSTTRPTGP
jgi:WD repeat-containing protein 19